MNFEINSHSSIKISSEKIIYIDPFNIHGNFNDADLIFITHNHYDHFSIEDVKKVININTKIICPKSMEDKIISSGINTQMVKYVELNKAYCIDNLAFKTVHAYNKIKSFHPFENDWCGYIIHVENNDVYVMGDCDENADNLAVKTDVVFIPIGGTYTFDINDAINYILKVKPKIAIPTHYGSIVGNKNDGLLFKKELNKIDSKIEVKVLL